MLVLLVSFSPPTPDSSQDMGVGGPPFLEEGTSVGCVLCVLQGSCVGGHCKEEEEKDSFPKGCLCFRLFSQAEETGCRSPTTSAAPPQLHAFVLSLHNSWKSLFSLSMAGPCAQQLNYPQDLRVPDCCSDNGPEQLHSYCLFQESHMSMFIWA